MQSMQGKWIGEMREHANQIPPQHMVEITTVLRRIAESLHVTDTTSLVSDDSDAVDEVLGIFANNFLLPAEEASRKKTIKHAIGIREISKRMLKDGVLVMPSSMPKTFLNIFTEPAPPLSSACTVCSSGRWW